MVMAHVPVKASLISQKSCGKLMCLEASFLVCAIYGIFVSRLATQCLVLTGTKEWLDVHRNLI
jgi:hypothetical protein